MGSTMGKPVFGHMQTAMVQISLCIFTVWSGPLSSANSFIGYYRIFQLRANAWMRLWACAERCVYKHAQNVPLSMHKMCLRACTKFCACSKAHFVNARRHILCMLIDTFSLDSASVIIAHNGRGVFKVYLNSRDPDQPRKWYILIKTFTYANTL